MPQLLKLPLTQVCRCAYLRRYTGVVHVWLNMASGMSGLVLPLPYAAPARSRNGPVQPLLSCSVDLSTTFLLLQYFRQRKHSGGSLPGFEIVSVGPCLDKTRDVSNWYEQLEEYQFIPKYLSGLTKTDQFKKCLHFHREFIVKHELLQNDFTGSKVLEQRERKPAKERKSLKIDGKELQKIWDCDPLHFKQPQVAEKVFEDICDSSLIFGDILKEIKCVHIAIFTLHFQNVLPVILQLRYWSVKETHVHQFLLVLQNELEMMWVSQTSEDQTAQWPCPESDNSAQSRYIAKVANELPWALKGLRAPGQRLSHQDFLALLTALEVEGSITEILDKLRSTQENQKKVWELIEIFLLLEEEEQASENPEENKGNDV
nr:PREDICTED: uncharacterized protein C6orf118 homolog [Struthio camelus australis]